MSIAVLTAATLLGAAGLDITWTAPVGCPDAAVVRGDVAMLVGRSLDELPGGTVIGGIESVTAGYRLTLELTGPQGQQERRELEADDCRTLGRAAALMVAVAVDAVATGKAIAPVLRDEPRPDPTPSEPAAPPPLPATEPSAVEAAFEAAFEAESEAEAAPVDPVGRARGDHRFGLGVFAGAGWGLVPRGTGGVQAEVGWLWRGVRVSAAAHHWFSRTEPLEPGVAVAAALSGASARGCYALSFAPMEFPFCAVVDLGALHGGGRGALVDGRSDADLYVGVGVGVGADWVPRPRFALRVRVDVIAAARRPGFHLNDGENRDEVFRMPPVSVRLVLGPQLRLP